MLHLVVHIIYKDLVHQMQLKNEYLKYISLFFTSEFIPANEAYETDIANHVIGSQKT